MNEWSYTAAPVATKFHAVARGMKGGLHPRSSVRKERDNNLTGNDRLIMERWKQCLYETVNTFAASYLNTQGFNNSCLKSPSSTLVDLTFQSRALRSFSLNQLRNLSL